MIVRLTRTSLALAPLLTAASGGGCASHSASAALGAAAAVGMGVPIATRSHVEVQIDVFNQGGKEQFVDLSSPLGQRVLACAIEKEKKAHHKVIVVYGRPLDDPERIAQTYEPLDKLAEAFPENVQTDNPTVSKGLAAVKRTSERGKALRQQAIAVRSGSTTAPSRIALTHELAAFATGVAQTHRMIAHPDFRAAATRPGLVDAATEATELGVSENVGPLAGEVTQVVLAKGDAIDAITNIQDAKNWLPFAHASSEGGTGNHDAVIYLENMGWPVLKSSKFNPSKFIEAFGKTYRVAFGALASAYGVPLSGSSATATGKGVEGLDATSSEFKRKAAQARIDADRKALLDKLDDLVKLYNDKLAKANHPTKDDATEIQAKLNQMSTDFKALNAVKP